MLQKELQNYPDGKLVCCNYEKRCKWYQSDGHTKVYIPKGNKKLAEQLAIKTYLSGVLNELFNEKRALDSYLKHYRSNLRNTEKLLEKNPGYSELLSPYFKPKSQELREWMNLPYEHNTNHPEHLIHKTSQGHMVRSKSEAMIALSLFTNQIPFRYECVLYLENTAIYPDFTIRHPHTGEFYYWEHFGLMDDPSYCKQVSLKLQTYISNGIIPSINLITTYETKQKPLSTEVIQKTIEHYFL